MFLHDKSQEYLRICQRTPGPSNWQTKRKVCQAATTNYEANRYRDVLAQDVGLVDLPDDVYINANFVKINKDKYIMCQAPLPTTFQHHYAMIWQHKVFVSVMLTALDEGLRHKADCYWPILNETLVISDEFTVQNTAEVKLDGIITLRILEITHAKTSETRQHYHLQYENWHDHSVPKQLEEIKTLLSYMKVFGILGHDKCYADVKIIHCSAGIGRSGTLVACDQVSKYPNLNVSWLVERIRRQRLGAVQDLSQYQFIYDFLYSNCKSDITSASNKRCRLIQSC
jgi:protein tyrosine phosphatase